MYETIKIAGKLKPKYVIWENVRNLLSKKHRHNFDNYLDKMAELGYRNYYQVLNAKDYGIPQNRERVFTISIRTDIEKEFHFPEKQELKLRLKDMLEEQVDEKYYLSDKGIKYVEKRDGGYTQIATEQTEIAHCPITAKGNDNWTGNFIKIKNATKKGYQEAIDGDSINLTYPKSKTRRGRVGKQVAQTIQCNENMGVAVAAADERNKKEQLCDYLVENDMVKENDVIRHSYSQSRQDDWEHRGTETHNISPTLDTRSDCLGVATKDVGKLRIRKLTPKECWRLMGFKDDEFEKAEKVNSNSQLYKQAGNSIVVNVLEKILGNLLGEIKNDNRAREVLEQIADGTISSFKMPEK